MEKSEGDFSLENLWEQLLSRQPERARAVFFSLAPEQQAAVLDHLKRMVTEAGWHPEQRISAEAALESIKGSSS
jgi:hypothetical protein